MVSRKKINILLIIIAILLILGIAAVYIIGEKKLKQSRKKDYLGAEEVNAEIIDKGDNNLYIPFAE